MSMPIREQQRMLKADVLKVMLFAHGVWTATRFYGPDASADGGHVDTTGIAARLIVAELERAGSRGRAPSGLEKVMKAQGFSDPRRSFVFGLDRLRRDGCALTARGNGRGGLIYRLERAA